MVEEGSFEHVKGEEHVENVSCMKRMNRKKKQRKYRSRMCTVKVNGEEVKYNCEKIKKKRKRGRGGKKTCSKNKI